MKAIAQHYIKNLVEAPMAADYLCLGLGHNDMAKELSDHLYTKFRYKVDVVSLYLFHNKYKFVNIYFIYSITIKY